MESFSLHMNTLSDCLKSSEYANDYPAIIGRGVAAATALGAIKDRRAVEILIQALKFRHRDVQAAAAGALAELGDPRAIEPLAVVAGNIRDGPDRDRLREDFLGPLQTLQTVFPVEAFRTLAASGSAYARAKAAEIGGRHPDSAILDALIALSKDPADAVRLEACKSLSTVSGGIGGLIEALNDSYWLVRVTAATGLGRLKDSRAVEPLIAAMERCPEALYALFEIGGSRAVEAATLTLQKPRDKWGSVTHYKVGAIRFLARTNDTCAVTLLIDLLNMDTTEHSDRDIRQALVFAFSQMGDPRALPSLIERNAQWTGYDQGFLLDAIAELVAAHITALPKETLESLGRLRDFKVRYVEQRDLGDLETYRVVSYEHVRRIAAEELRRRQTFSDSCA
jgi:HEAT repeat protein